MDCRFIAWAGYQFTATGDGNVEITIAGVCPPEFTSEDVGELYITNFKTDKNPAKYTVEIWRLSTDCNLGRFIFETAK